MDIINITLGAVVFLSALALAAMSAYKYGFKNGIVSERGLSDRRVQGVLAELSKSPKRLNVPKRKRKAVRA